MSRVQSWVSKNIYAWVGCTFPFTKHQTITWRLRSSKSECSRKRGAKMFGQIQAARERTVNAISYRKLVKRKKLGSRFLTLAANQNFDR